jgi:putative membrane protein
MKFRGLLALACAGALMAGCQGNRTSNTIATNNETGTTGTAGNGVSTRDKNWVSDMLADGTAEVELAKMAKDHAASAEVKQFADMMVQDHTKAGDELKQIATTYAIPTDVKIDDKHRNLMDKLSKLNGADFDKEYMSAMVDDHQDVVGDLRSRVDEDRSASDRLKGKNPENPAAVKPKQSDNTVTMRLNEWAANTLPTIERHLDRAKEIKDNLDHGTRTTRGTTGTNETKPRNETKPKGASKY